MDVLLIADIKVKENDNKDPDKFRMLSTNFKLKPVQFQTTEQRTISEFTLMNSDTDEKSHLSGKTGSGPNPHNSINSDDLRMTDPKLP